MNEMTAELGFDQASFEAFLQTRSEPDWLINLRRDAWSKFCELPWPARNEEEWIRTDIRLFKLNHYCLPGPTSSQAPTPDALLGIDVELGGQVLTVDSRPRESHLESRWADLGVLFGSLESVLADHGDLILPHFLRRAVDPNIDKFSALHAACWSGGQILYVPKGVIVDQKLHAIAVMSDGGIDFSHTLVILEEGAQATLLSENASTTSEDGGLHCGAIELLVGPRAHLRYIDLQNWGSGVWHFAHQKGLIDQDASLQWTIGALGSRLAKVNQHVALTGPGADCQVNGVMFTEGKQHLSYHTLQHHQAPSCRSDLLYKAALQDRSRTVWRGMIKVDPKAQKTDGYQRNDNLLLSSRARADSIPGLEIEADDVRCTHGSTSGRVDEELIFYACSRGFTRKEAIRLIVTGFFQKVFDRITIESVREALTLAIARRVREYQ